MPRVWRGWWTWGKRWRKRCAQSTWGVEGRRERVRTRLNYDIGSKVVGLKLVWGFVLMPPLSQVNAEVQIYKVELNTLSFAEIVWLLSKKVRLLDDDNVSVGWIKRHYSVLCAVNPITRTKLRNLAFRISTFLSPHTQFHFKFWEMIPAAAVACCHILYLYRWIFIHR